METFDLTSFVDKFNNVNYEIRAVRWTYHASGPFPHPLKASQYLWFSDVFRRCGKRSMAWSGLRNKWRFWRILVVLHYTWNVIIQFDDNFIETSGLMIGGTDRFFYLCMLVFQVWIQNFLYFAVWLWIT